VSQVFRALALLEGIRHWPCRRSTRPSRQRHELHARLERAAQARHGSRRYPALQGRDRKSTRLNSSHGSISYAVFCLKKTNIRVSYMVALFASSPRLHAVFHHPTRTSATTALRHSLPEHLSTTVTCRQQHPHLYN